MEFQANPNYFDYASTAPPWKEAMETYVQISGAYFGNPSSLHAQGKATKQKLLELKMECCDLLGFHDGRLLLCASGSEANNTIIEGHIAKFPKGRLLIAEDVHDSIWYATEKHKNLVDVLKIDQKGQYSLQKFERLLSKGISLVCINHVCNETGAIHPVKEMAELCFKNQVKILIDGMQAVGHIPIDLDNIPCTYYSISGHKFGSVKGTGGIFMRDDQFEPLINGGKQEWNLRAGTEHIAGLSSMVVALRKSLECLEEETKRLSELKKFMIQQLPNTRSVLVNSPEHSVPGILSISIPGVSGREVVGALSILGFAVSTGSACHSNQMEPSRIILAMGRNKVEAIGTVRISMGLWTSIESSTELMNLLVDRIK